MTLLRKWFSYLPDNSNLTHVSHTHRGTFGSFAYNLKILGPVFLFAKERHHQLTRISLTLLVLSVVSH